MPQNGIAAPALRAKYVDEIVLGWVGNEGNPVLVVAQTHGAGNYHAAGVVSEQLKSRYVARLTMSARHS
jgi:hypothetical protein